MKKRSITWYDKVVPISGSGIFAVMVSVIFFMTVMMGTAQILTEGNGEGRWENNFIRLMIDENPAGNVDSWAKFRIVTSLDFDAIQTLSCEYKLINGSRTPRMVLELDIDGNNHGDTWINQWTNESVTGEWLSSSKDDWYVYSLIPNLSSGMIHKTLEELQGDLNGKVVAVKIVVGGWTYTDAHDALISSIKVNNNELIPQPTLTPIPTPSSKYYPIGGGGPKPSPTLSPTPIVTPTPTVAPAAPSPIPSITPSPSPTVTPTPTPVGVPLFGGLLPKILLVVAVIFVAVLALWLWKR